MTVRLLVGAASVALVAAAGTAQAADVMPVVVPMITPVAVVSTGPDVEITIEALGQLYWDGGPVYTGVGIAGEATIVTTSGWGVGVGAGAFLGLTPSAGLEFYGIGGRVFRQVGDFQVGFAAAVDIGFMAPPFGFGTDIRYDNGPLSVLNQTYFRFSPGGFEFWGIYTDIEYEADRLEFFQSLDVQFWGPGVAFYAEGDVNLQVRGPFHVFAGYDLETGPFPSYFGVYGGVQLDLNGIKPYIHPWWENDGDFGLDIGVDIERQIGNGPFSLVGWSEFTIANYGWDYEMAIGFRYEIGGE